MPVYMIRSNGGDCGINGPVKIGFASDMPRRLQQLQTGHAERLRIMRLFEGGAAEEKMLHRMFAKSRFNSEWFVFTRAMLGPVGLKEIRDFERETASNAKREPMLCTSDTGCEVCAIPCEWAALAFHLPWTA